MNRPLVLISRFQGNSRDGHGNHQTAGLMTQEAFKAAGDPAMFPEQISEGLRPWQPLKLYMGGMRENEDWTIRIDTGEYSPWLGESYNDFARIGLSFQRSQNSGRLARAPGPSFGYYKRLASKVTAPDKEDTFFDGIDTSLSGMFTTLQRPAPPGAVDALKAIEREVDAAVHAFTVGDPSLVVPALARGLAGTRRARELVSGEPEAVFLLDVEEREFMDAINTALGLELTAEAQPTGTTEPTGPFAAFAPPASFAPPVPGQSFEVVARLTNRGRAPITPTEIRLSTGRGWTVTPSAEPFAPLAMNAGLRRRFAVTLADDAPLTSRPYFARRSVQENRYEVIDASSRHRPAAAPPVVVARYSVDGVPVEVSEPLRRREPHLPYGYEMRELTVVPVLGASLSPTTAVIPAGTGTRTLTLQADVVHNREGETMGRLALEMPQGWTARPAAQEFRFARAGERRAFSFEVTVPSLADRAYTVQAVATVGGKEYREGYELIEHRDLETRYLYRPAQSEVRGVDVKVPAGLRVGYVMGVGDQVPAGIAQLGARVQLLDDKDLATGNLAQFDAVVTGTRAYAVREDLRTYNQRLLDYVRDGGNLIVLYNTQEFVPAQFAPFKAELPRNAEEVSEEDSPVEILAPGDPVLTSPNRISAADFQGWVEQRGSKFWSTWDPAYTPLIATHDIGQPPQKGGWLTARYGKGHYTYFAYAMHRQLPYGVPGAYRLMANLLSLGKTAGPDH
jgi:hypothetical protein